MTGEPAFDVPDVTRGLDETTITVVDVETTGLYPVAGDRVCEIAMIRQLPDGEEQTFTTLIDPQRPISAKAAEVNQITPEMLKGQPRFENVIDNVDRMLRGAVFIAHNASFDSAFLVAEYARLGRAFPPLPVIDTLDLARRYLALPSNRLGAVAEALGVTQSSAHRALADTRTTLEVFRKLIRRKFPDGAADLLELVTPNAMAQVQDAEIESFSSSLASLIRTGAPFSVTYEDARGSLTERTIRVVSTIRYGSHVYLAAQCHASGGNRHFRLDRLREWKSSDDTNGRE